MMSLINTNKDYLSTMGIAEEDAQVGLIVSVYYLGTAVGAVLISWFANRFGRKPALFLSLALASLGNLIMFISGLGFSREPLAPLIVMYLGRVVMGLGIGGVDSVVPVYSSELSSDDSRGKALAQEFQANIFGLNMVQLTCRDIHGRNETLANWLVFGLGIRYQLGKLNLYARQHGIHCLVLDVRLSSTRRSRRTSR